MPIARFKMPDGRVARFQVPDGTTQEQAQSMFNEFVTAQSSEQPEPVKIGKEAFPEALKETLRESDWGTRNLAGAGTALSNLYEGGKQLVEGSELYNLLTKGRFATSADAKGDQQQIQANRIIAEEAPIGALAGNAAVAAIPFGMVGKSIPGAAAVGATMGGLQGVEGDDVAAGRIRNTAIGGLAGAAGQAVANKAGQVIGNKIQSLQQRQAQNVARDAALKEAQDAGLVVPPSIVNPTLTNKALTGFAGKLTTQQQASAKNQEVFNAMARRALGLPDDAPLTDEALAAFRASKAGPYRELSALGDDAAKAVEDLKQARFDSKAYWNFYNRSGDPKAREAAKQLDNAVSSLESVLEKRASYAGRADLLPALKEARKEIAKAHTIGKALNDATGNVSARALGKEKYLTGELKTAADFAKAFPKAAQPVEQIGAMPGISPLDFVGGGIMGGAGASALGPGGLLAAGVPFLRPAARSLLLSAPYQKLMANPNYSLGMLPRVTGGLLDYAPAGATALALPAFGQ